MELSPDWVIEVGQLMEPSFQIAGAHSSISAPFLIPVDSICRIVTRQRSIGLPGMIVDGSQRPHAAIRYVGAIFLGKPIVFFRDANRIFREIEQRGVEPFRKKAFDVITIAIYRFLAASFADQVGF